MLAGNLIQFATHYLATIEITREIHLYESLIQFPNHSLFTLLYHLKRQLFKIRYNGFSTNLNLCY